MHSAPFNLTVNTNDMENEIFADLAMVFANRPLFRYGFPTDEGAMAILLKHFHDKIFRVYRWRKGSPEGCREAVLRFDDFSYVYIQNNCYKSVYIYSDTAENAEALEKQIRELLPPPVRTPDEPWFYMLREDDGFSIEKIVNKSAPLDEESLDICYGPDSLNWVTDFAKNTQARSGGITILDGPPGTGKSTLIAELMRRLYQTHVFYVLPVAQQVALSQPSMVEFWQEQNASHPDAVKVIIMEDAEKILLQRRDDTNEAVSALLNIADGLMGQMLRVHVLCTLNQGMEYLDPAILRPGRLRSHRFVGPLTRERAEKLASKHKLPFVADTREHYTLAEVFHGKVYNPKVTRAMGFQMKCC
ncbi:MAG: AAA family ATPase [Candidatus Methylacidiphilales bacterium]|nr:AAA family ATPase [Candidatus Methylacidiphilales bacterium]